MKTKEKDSVVEYVPGDAISRFATSREGVAAAAINSCRRLRTEDIVSSRYLERLTKLWKSP
jgi:hypothetical protein